MDGSEIVIGQAIAGLAAIVAAILAGRAAVRSSQVKAENARQHGDANQRLAELESTVDGGLRSIREELTTQRNEHREHLGRMHGDLDRVSEEIQVVKGEQAVMREELHDVSQRLDSHLAESNGRRRARRRSWLGGILG